MVFLFLVNNPKWQLQKHREDVTRVCIVIVTLTKVDSCVKGDSLTLLLGTLYTTGVWDALFVWSFV